MPHKIAVIGGDGIGPEVISVALDVMRAAGAVLDTTEFRLGGFRYLEDGVVLLTKRLLSCAPMTLFCLELSALLKYHRE